jgi:hypothetical protein
VPILWVGSCHMHLKVGQLITYGPFRNPREHRGFTTVELPYDGLAWFTDRARPPCLIS